MPAPAAVTVMPAMLAMLVAPVMVTIALVIIVMSGLVGEPDHGADGTTDQRSADQSFLRCVTAGRKHSKHQERNNASTYHNRVLF